MLQVLLTSAVLGAGLPDLAGPPEGTGLETALVGALDAALPTLRARADAPHYVALSVHDEVMVEVSASMGTLVESQVQPHRYLDADVRVGTPDLDSTHPLRGTSAFERRSRGLLAIPLWDEPTHALRFAIWNELDARYRDAAERIQVLRANQAVKVEEEVISPDFEPRTGQVAHLPVPRLEVDVPRWERLLVRLSDLLDAQDGVWRSEAAASLQQVRKTFVDSEGTRLVHGGLYGRVSLSATGVAGDGDELEAYEIFTWRDPSGAPTEDQLVAAARVVSARLQALLVAPRGQPFSGPVILNGRAAGVFFHEIMGHRVEGHRQKRDDEGKTFKEYVGKPVLPAFIDVVDDPTVSRLAGNDLYGHYRFDDEGVAAQPALLVEGGVFRGFLMGRSPIPGFPTSNGHGRRSPGNEPVSRMGNTIVRARTAVPYAELRRLLIQEIKVQKLPYGMVVDDIAGGFTMTGRSLPNAFAVQATVAWRVYADGRPDEMVRGVDLVGTPLVAFSAIRAAGDDPAVFNGFCGAESGNVPVSAVSPSLFFSRLEFQLKEKADDRPPLLPRPPASGPLPTRDPRSRP